MISKNKIKLIRSLEQRKFRKELQLFVAEGHKLVEELLPAFACTFLAARKEWFEKQEATSCQRYLRQAAEVLEVSADELQRASLQKHPQDVLAIFRQRPDSIPPAEQLCKQLCIGLDGIQDPGNIGTIIRIADWFGIEHIFCSPDTADLYNPKTVQATMGAMARVHVHYTDLPALLSALSGQMPVCGTFLDGDDIYRQTLPPNGIIVMGNEGNGISPATAAYINKKLYIPSFPPERTTSESLNVAVATAITCAEFRRQAGKH